MKRLYALTLAVLLLGMPVPAQDTGGDDPVPPPSQDDAGAAIEEPAPQEAEPAPAKASASASAVDLTAEAVTARLDELQTAEGMDESRRTRLVDLWQQTLTQVREQESAASHSTSFAAASAEAADDVIAAREALAGLPAADTTPDLSAAEGLDLAGLESLLVSAEGEVSAADKAVRDLETERAQRTARRREIPALVSTAREELLALESASTSSDDNDEALALRSLNTARQDALESGIAALEAESRSYEDRRELLTTQQDLALRRQALVTAHAAGLRSLVEAQRLAKREAEAQAAAAALRELRFSHPALKALAERESELTQTGLELESQVADTTRRLAEVEAESESIRTQRENVREKLDKLGFTNVLGLLLRRHKAELPSLTTSLRTTADQEALDDIQLLLLELEEERSDLTNLDGWVTDQLVGVDPAPHFPDRESLADALREAAAAYRTRLDDLLGAAQARFDQLVSLDLEQRLLENRVSEYDEFISERILWIPDADALGKEELAALPGDIAWLFSAEAWSPLWRALGNSFSERPTRDTLVALTLLGLLALRPLVRRRLTILAERADAPRATIAPTLRALFHTLVAAAILPAILWGIGWRFELQTEVEVTGGSLQQIALLILPFTLMAAISLPAGLGERHFGWPEAACGMLRKHTVAMLLFVAPLLVTVMLRESSGRPELEPTLGALGRMLFMAGLGVYLHKVLKRTGPLEAVLAATRKTKPTIRLRPLGHLLSIVIPVALLALLALGYSYAERVVAQNLLRTALMLMVLLLARGLSLRFLVLQRRRIERRQEAAAAEDEASRVVDVTRVSLQARQLIGSVLFVLVAIGSWSIWDDVIPALGFFDSIELWERTLEVVTQGVDGSESAVERVVGMVSLTDLLFSLVLLALTAVAMRNLPGLLDVLMLSHLELMPGTVYAIKALVGYVLLLTGIVWSCSNIGLTWSQLQWFVASMGVGLGFGLQEVFANFISGIILLFERPVRVGDVVTVGQTMGVITRIQMRATTIRDWNRRELLVPNRRFIAEDVTNWTLSDAITRLVFPVAVAPGTDKALVKKLLDEVVADVPEVLEEPPAYAICLGYEEGLLRFELRLYLASFGERLSVTDNVNCGIDDRFGKAGVQVAPPRQEIMVQEFGGNLRGGGREDQLRPRRPLPVASSDVDVSEDD
jgi:potassium efflux system protein